MTFRDLSCAIWHRPCPCGVGGRRPVRVGERVGFRSPPRSALDRNRIRIARRLRSSVSYPKTREPIEIKGWQRNFRSSIANARNASTEQVSPVRPFVSAMRSSTLRAARRRTADRLRVHFIEDSRCIDSGIGERSGSSSVETGTGWSRGLARFCDVVLVRASYAAEPLGRIGFRVKQSGTGAIVDAN